MPRVYEEAQEINPYNDRQVKIYVQWLKDVLIPDLHESGTHETAEDFERCVEIIEARLP